jgi:hypothetical protein
MGGERVARKRIAAHERFGKDEPRKKQKRRTMLGEKQRKQKS